MNIKNQIIEFAKKHSLKEKALSSVNEVMNTSIEADKEIGIDFMEGHDRNELIYEFDRYEFQIDKKDNSRIVTRINIYSEKLCVPNYNLPVGYYEEWTDLMGEHLDEFLIFDWSPLQIEN